MYNQRQTKTETVKSVINDLIESGELVTRKDIEHIHERLDKQDERIDRVVDSVDSLTEEVRNLVRFLSGNFAQTGSMAGNPTTPRPAFSAPTTDEFDFEIKQASRDENNNSTYNFLIASALNVLGNVHNLDPEVIEYGLRTGRIPADMAPKAPKKTGNPKQLANANAPLSVPNFDDIEINF